jgi:ketosteroid isomerase-like protein
MSERENVKLVQDAYAAFGRGDIPAIIESLADDVDWQFKGPASVPWAGHWRKRQDVPEFFKRIAEAVDVESFEPGEYVAQGDSVVALGRFAGKAKPTGRRFEIEWAMAWTVRGGKVTRYRQYTDTATIAEAHAKR